MRIFSQCKSSISVLGRGGFDTFISWGVKRPKYTNASHLREHPQLPERKRKWRNLQSAVSKIRNYFVMSEKSSTFVAFFRYLGIQYAEVCYFRRFLPETLHVA